MSQETAVSASRAGSGNARDVVGREIHRLVPATDSIVVRLAQFFPDATPVRIPIQVTAGEIGGVGLADNTVIEYGTPNEVLFTSVLPLEFSDRLKIRTADGSLDAEVFVVGVQYHGGQTAVAARFVSAVKNWIVKA